jgi:predicted DNA-binding transcriptional regulator AlpA
MNSTQIRPRTVELIDQFLRPFSSEGLLTVAEHKEVVAQLRHLATKGTPLPPIEPRLIDQREAAELLGIGLANFKKLEPTFPFTRRMVGSSVRFRNLDVIRYVLAEEPAGS